MTTKVDDNESSTDILSLSLGALSIDDDNKNIYKKYEQTQKAIGYLGWKITPTDHHMRLSLSTDEIINILTNDATLDIPLSSMPQIKKLPRQIVIQPYKQIEPPAGKPNLLIALASVLHDIVKSSNTNDIDNILSILNNTINIITVRNSIKKIFSYYVDQKDDWTCYVCRPVANGPLFIERGDVYTVNTGTVGNIFESTITTSSIYNRCYVISKADLDKNVIVMTGEIDGCDDAGNILEIKTKPAWLSGDRPRLLSNWIQSSLTGTKKILTGGFYTDKNDRKKGPVSFPSNLIMIEKLQEYCHNNAIDNNSQNDIYRYGSNILTKINDSCVNIGTVYEIRNDKNDIINILVKECTYNFPINETILKNTTNAIIEISENNKTTSKTVFQSFV